MKTKIGSKLLTIREDRKMNQQEFAYFLGIPYTTYGRLERNESSIEMEKIVEIADKLELPINEFLPDNLSIQNSNSDKGFGGIFFGNQIVHNYYAGDAPKSETEKDEEIDMLKKEIDELKKKVITLSSK